jgi:hypothetical protein
MPCPTTVVCDVAIPDGGFHADAVYIDAYPLFAKNRNRPMAQRTVVQLVDDIDGTQITDNQGETVTFGLDGATYEIDLTTKNARELREAVQVYIANGRRIGGGRGRPAGSARTSSRPATKRDPQQTRAIKDWAKANGHKVAERGRISQTVIEAYEAAH